MLLILILYFCLGRLLGFFMVLLIDFLKIKTILGRINYVLIPIPLLLIISTIEGRDKWTEWEQYGISIMLTTAWYQTWVSLWKKENLV